MELKPGGRYRSQVCATEVIVVRPVPGDVDLTCGGAAMVDLAETPPEGGEPAPGLDTGNVTGKRYTDEEGNLEILVTKNGAGTLAIGTAPLQTKEAKPLPASD
jgi:hypothetical protein